MNTVGDFLDWAQLLSSRGSKDPAFGLGNIYSFLFSLQLSLWVLLYSWHQHPLADGATPLKGPGSV